MPLIVGSIRPTYCYACGREIESGDSFSVFDAVINEDAWADRGKWYHAKCAPYRPNGDDMRERRGWQRL